MNEQHRYAAAGDDLWSFALHAPSDSEAAGGASRDGISIEVERFIAEEISSVEQLEVLLLLCRHAEKWWSAAEVYDEVKSSCASVQERLNQFAARGLVQAAPGDPPQYRFAPPEEHRARVVRELDREYRERRVRVIELIYSEVSRGAAEFARAFRIW